MKKIKLDTFRLSKKAIASFKKQDKITEWRNICIRDFATITKDTISFVADIMLCEKKSEFLKTLKKYGFGK